MKNYLLSCDSYVTAAVVPQLDAFIKNNRHVTSWAKPFHGCYLLRSGASSEVLQASMNDFFEGKVLFLITEVKSSATVGLLNQEVWSWLNQPSLFDDILG